MTTWQDIVMENATQGKWDGYPCIVFKTRYTGVYEGGAWAALPLDEVPWPAVSDDIECADWWANPGMPVGVGATADEAYVDLLANSDIDERNVDALYREAYEQVTPK